MNYPKSFIALIEESKPKTYIGTGNPDGKILIVGKECAIDKENRYDQYVLEIENNIEDWKKNLPSCSNTQPQDVDVWINPIRKPIYNPLYPYKGQENTIRREIKDKTREGIIKVIKPNGTSSTFYNYQKLYQLITGEKSDTINFHEECFITELNQTPSKKSSDQTPKDRQENIENRKPIFKKEFFNKFPIIILACSKQYITIAGGVIETMDARWKLDQEINTNGLYAIYKSKDQILILTRQLSMYLKPELLPTLANHCKGYY